MTTALVAYLTATMSTTLTTANKLYVTSGSPTVQENLVLIGTANGYGEICSQGSVSAWAALGSIGAPTGKGWLLDSNVLDNQQLVIGAYSGSLRSGFKLAGNSANVVYYQRWWKYTASGGTYTAIITLTSTSQALSGSSAITVSMPSNSSIIVTNFAPGDFLYIDEWANVSSNTGSGTQNFRVGNLSLDVSGLTGASVHSSTSPGYQVGITTSSQTVTELNAVVETTNALLQTSAIESIATKGTLSVTSILAIIEANAVTEFVSGFNVYGAVVVESNDVTESVNAQSNTAAIESIAVVETRQVQASTTAAENIAVVETIYSAGIFLAVVNESNAVVELVTLQASTTRTESVAVSEVLALQAQTKIIESIAVVELVTLASPTPVPVDTTAQMLYDTLQQQYSRLRTSSTNNHIAVIGLVYFPPAQILSEHSIPGELDVVLIGETYSQAHVLKTIDDVTAFIAANP